MRTFIVALAFACVCFVESTFILEGAAAGGYTVALASGSQVAFGVLGLGIGALVLKAVALNALNSRHRRSAIDEADQAFTYIAQTEPEQCYRRLICDLATGNMEKSENDVILSLFNKPVKASQPIYEYQVAALVGKSLKNVQACEIRYSCQLTGAQIQKYIN